MNHKAAQFGLLKKCNFAFQKDIHLKQMLKCKVKKEKPAALCHHFTLHDNGVANSF